MKSSDNRSIFDGVELRELLVDLNRGTMEARFALVSSKSGLASGRSTFPMDHWMSDKTKAHLERLYALMEEDALTQLFPPEGKQQREEENEPDKRSRGLVTETEDATPL